MTEWWHVAVAIYAAIVATGALALEIRRWFEGRARLVINITLGMKTVNMPGTEDNTYALVTVMNRGASGTTLTHLALLEYANWWQRLRGRHGPAAVIAKPTPPGSASGRLPHFLEPGGNWTGIIVDDEDFRKWIDTRRLYVAVYASHSDKPIRRRLLPERQKPKSLKGAKER